MQLVYGPTPSAYERQDNQHTASGDILDRPHIANTPAANYLRQQGYGQPSPFTTVPLPTGWQMPAPWSHQVEQYHHLQSSSVPHQLEGCSRPIPRRIVSSGNKSIPEATLRAIGLSHDTMQSQEAQTDRLDLLISAIDQSENNIGGGEDWDGTGTHRDGDIKEPSSPASVNTLQGSPTTSTGVPLALRAAIRPSGVSDGINEHALAAAAAALIGTNGPVAAVPTAPVVLQATPAVPIATNVTNTASATTLADALAQLTNNTNNKTPADAVQSLVEVMATHPELAQQFRRLLNQPREPSAFTEQYHLYQAPPQPALQQQQQHSLMQERGAPPPTPSPAAAANEQDLIMHLLQQRQQQQLAAVDASGTGAAAGPSAAAAALRRAQLSAKFQTLQAKLATRLVALQKLQNHMEYQNAMADQQTQAHHIAAPLALPSPVVTATAPTAAASTGIGSNAHAFSAGDVTGTMNTNAGATQNERREALFRLLAAKLQNQQHQHNHHQQQQQQAFS